MKIDKDNGFIGRMLQNKYLCMALFLTAFLSALFSVVFAGTAFTQEDSLLRHAAPSILQDGWSARTEDGDAALPEASRPTAEAVGETLTLVNTLPSELPSDSALCFQTKNESVRVWVDGILCYTYGEQPQRVFGYGVGAVWHITQLPPSSAGKTIAVELSPIGGRTGLEPYSFLLGDRGDIISFLLMERLDMLAICLTLLLIGLAALVVAAAGVLRRSRWLSASGFYFALFTLLAALWNAADSGLLQFVIGNKGIIYMLFGCSFYLLCTPFALFMATMLPERAKEFRIFAVMNSAYALVRICLYMAGVLDFETGLWLLHLLMAALILYINLTLWLPVVRTGKLDAPELCLAITFFTLLSAISLMDFYLGDKLDMQRCSYSSGFYVGILVFVLFTILGFMRVVNEMRHKALKADFYEQRASTDELTGLLNARGFDEKCAQVLRSAPADMCCAVVDFDVNFFSQYNANNGLEKGDALIRRISRLLLSKCMPNEICARQEADHFVCLLNGGSLEDITTRIRETDKLFRGNMEERMLLISYGVAEVTDRFASPAELRNQALVAKRTVKGNYERTLAIYDQRLHQAQLREMALLSGFEAALVSGEYVIFLQPKIFVATGVLGGAEALVRRIAPDGSITSAGEIIEALEQKGFVAKLDFYVLEQVCRFQRGCLDKGLKPCPISSNFSRVHLYDPAFPEKVAATVDSYGIPHELLEIELTETVFLSGKEVLRSMVQRLHNSGFAVSIDDFGSGYSSLNILKDVPVDAIKLDREFLADFAKNDRAEIIIQHTVNLAQSMGISSVAEGVETTEQLDFLRRLGCDLVQGYYYSHPLPTDEFAGKYLNAASE